MTKSAIAATSPIARAGAEEMRRAHGSAVDSVLAGFFADAGARDAVLLAPMTALVVGVGAGSRALDARARQPGLASERPRGTAVDHEPPLGARVSASVTPLGTILLHNAYHRASFSDVVAMGRDQANAVGERRRAALLEDLGTLKAGACSSEPFVEALLAVGGRSAGGALSRADVVGVPPVVDLAHRASGTARIYEAPWAHEPVQRRGVVEIISAVDAWGLAAVLAYEVYAPSDVAAVPGLQIAAPLGALPVQRGVPRLAPGTAMPMRTPIAIVDRGAGNVVAVGAALAELPPGDAIADALSAEQALRSIEGAIACVALEARGARVLGEHAAP